MNEFQREFWALLKAAPSPPAELVSRTVREEADFIVEALTFDIGEPRPVRGFVTRPKQANGRLPAILYMHAHGDRFDIGALELLHGQPATETPLGPVFAREGYLTLMVEMPLFGERATISESALSKALLWRGKTLMGQMLSELTGALGYLAARDDVDPARIASYGISLGCTLAFMLAALDSRIKCTAHLCCYADYDVLIDLNAHDQHGHYLTIPGMLLQTSVGRIAGQIAPRPQLICIGEADELTPPAAVAKAFPETEAAYVAAGVRDRLDLFVESGVGHKETAAMRAKVLTFFAERL